jgi:hypothetical protein
LYLPFLFGFLLPFLLLLFDRRQLPQPLFLIAVFL